MTALYNANTRSAYQAGYYTGTFTMADILTHGDTGLGALDGNDGELLVDQGQAWRTAADGTTHTLTADATSPFATVIPWHTDRRFNLSQPMTKNKFETELAAHLPLDNRTWGLRISGQFGQVTAGAGGRQQAPTRPLADVMNDYRRQTWTDTTGTLIAFHCPVYLTGIDYVGGHYHWLSDDHEYGGHVFDFTTTSVTIEACEADSYATQLPATTEFHNLDLSLYH